MNLFELFLVKIIIFLRLDKLIDSFRSYVESRELRGDIERERDLRSSANISRDIMDNKSFADHFEKEADIIKNTGKKNEKD